LIWEDISESVTQDKIDTYEDTIFLVLHFPKYNANRQIYISNEFDMILRREQLITLSRFKSNHMQTIRDDYEEVLQDAEKSETYKFSSYYVLYRIIDTMYDKILRGLKEFAKDLSLIEEKMFESQTGDM
jgi:magnesium transporter